MASASMVERALFMIGDQDTGKSTQLRSLFLDHRLGNRGQVPDARNLPNSFALSNERRLYLRLTSPHEVGESLHDFFDKFDAAIAGGPQRRWCYAGPLQPTGTEGLADAPSVIGAFVRRYSPERVRAVILSPTWRGAHFGSAAHDALVDALLATPGVEVVTADARHRTANGLVYADFFDFT